MADSPQGHYFSSEPNVASARDSITVHLPDQRFDLVVDTGVFSKTRLDAGTRLLLLEAVHPDRSPVGPAPTVLDLGCGYGPIAVAAAKRWPDAEVWATDVNERALSLCAHNAAALELDTITVAAAEAIPAELRFDLIVSNPPIRVGKAALHELLSTWMTRLAPGGVAEMVVQKHLGSDSLARWLTEQGWPTERVVSRSGYRILRAHQNGTAS